MKKIIITCFFTFLLNNSFASNASDSLKYLELISEGRTLFIQTMYKASWMKFDSALKQKKIPVFKEDYIRMARVSTKCKCDDPLKYLNKILDIYHYFDSLTFVKDTSFNEIRKLKKWRKIIAKNNQNILLEKLKIPQWVDDTLKNIAVIDRNLRKELKEVSQKNDWQSIEYKKFALKIQSIDSINAVKLYQIVEKYGFLSSPIISDAAAGAYWLVLQHCPLEYKHKFLPKIKDAIIYGEYSMKDYAYFVDRLKTSEGKKQIFGTQVIRTDKNKKAVLMEVEDEINLNYRRKLVGLNTIEEYLKNFK